MTGEYDGFVFDDNPKTPFKLWAPYDGTIEAEQVKCEKCGLVFFHGTNQTSYSDTCPECGFSKMKKQRESGHN